MSCDWTAEEKGRRFAVRRRLGAGAPRGPVCDRPGVIRRCASPFAGAQGRPCGRSTLRVVRVGVANGNAIRAQIATRKSQRRAVREASRARAPATRVCYAGLPRRCRARIWISERPGQTEDYYPEDKEYLLEFEPEVQHYTVVAGSNAILAKGGAHD
jgi:hypothetical protein